MSPCAHSEDGTLHICWSEPSECGVKMLRCPDCSEGYRYGSRVVLPHPAPTSPVAWFDEGWYGFSCTCLRCGCTWQDGEILARPFEPGWRWRSIEDAKTRVAHYA